MASDKPVPIVVVPGPKHADHREVYTNTSKIGMGPWDLRLIFGHLIEGATASQQIIEDLVTVIMSPQHAKVLLSSWQNAIKTYEETFGVIPDLTDKVNALIAKETH
jgi:hypothetical protein